MNLSSPLEYEERLPISWRRLRQPLSEVDTARLNEMALVALQTVLAWNDVPAPDVGEETGPHAQELARLDLKLNMLLEMVAGLLSRDGALPEETRVRLSKKGLSWTTSNPPAVSGRICISVCLLRHVPKPVGLLAVANSVEPVEGGYRVDAEFVDLSKAVQDTIEKIIFRHHRREVAHARKDATGDS